MVIHYSYYFSSKKLQGLYITPSTSFLFLLFNLISNFFLNTIIVVQFEHVFEDSENVYILLELCPH
jgi:hypothetical protein